VGIVLRCKIGDRVAASEPVGQIHARSTADADAALHRVVAALMITDAEVSVPPLVHAWLDDGLDR
jgi:thymidine phosphorylase